MGNDGYQLEIHRNPIRMIEDEADVEFLMLCSKCYEPFQEFFEVRRKRGIKENSQFCIDINVNNNMPPTSEFDRKRRIVRVHTEEEPLNFIWTTAKILDIAKHLIPPACYLYMSYPSANYLNVLRKGALNGIGKNSPITIPDR